MKIALLLFSILAFLSCSIEAQNKEIRKKLKDLKGEPEKITIQTDSGEVTFEGEEAETVYKHLKKLGKKRNFFFNTPVPPMHFYYHPPRHRYYEEDDFFDEDFWSDDDEIFFERDLDDGNRIKIYKGNDSLDMIILDRDIDLFDDSTGKRVKIEIEDGKKKVTVTTKEDGKEKSEIYEGEEAEEYLKNLKKDDSIDILMHKKDGKRDKKIIIKKKRTEEI